MARPPLPLGQHGEFSIAAKRGVARWRGFDGVTRKPSDPAALPLRARHSRTSCTVSVGSAPKFSGPSPAVECDVADLDVFFPTAVA